MPVFNEPELGDTVKDVTKIEENALYSAVARRVPSNEPKPAHKSCPGKVKYIPLEPYIISWKQDDGTLYKYGLINLIGILGFGLLAVNTHKNPARIGADKLVPPITEFTPFTLIFIPV